MFKLQVIFILISFILSFNCYAGKVFNLGEIKIQDKIIEETRQKGDILFTGVSLDNKSLNLSGSGGKNSVYKAISILPNINLDSDDPYGLSDKRMRIRGTSDHFVGLTVEGIPNYGIMPIGPRDYIYDTENFDKIKVFSGSIPSDLMSGSGNRGGAIEGSIRRASNDFHISFDQNFGSFDYSKTFLRIDSGKLFNSNSKIYTSLSYTDADKWKGDGKLGPRKNINIGFTQKFGNWLNIDIFLNYNSINRNLFKGLTYFQAKNLDDFYYHDYNSNRTGKPLSDFDYYGYNKFSGINRDYFSIIKINISKNLKLSLKPYYSKEDSSLYEGMKSGNFAFILNKLNDSKRYGAITEFLYKHKSFEITAGYWHEITDFKPIIKKFGISPKGLIFKGYGWYTKSSSKGKVLSPFAKFGFMMKRKDF
jgi:iron complex outermembrane receptor protein